MDLKKILQPDITEVCTKCSKTFFRCHVVKDNKNNLLCYDCFRKEVSDEKTLTK